MHAPRRGAETSATMRSAACDVLGTPYQLALEGALKLKELSYVHVEGYAAGEPKHGPIALIDTAMPVMVIVRATPCRNGRCPTFTKSRRAAAGSRRSAKAAH